METAEKTRVESEMQVLNSQRSSKGQEWHWEGPRVLGDLTVLPNPFSASS